MSADTMPCGCLGHADHEDLCRYPALEAERDGLRTRVEQAERERDEARNGWLRDAELLQRAEANNAGLRYALGTLARACPDEGAPTGEAWAQWLVAVGVAEHALATDHLGDALVDLADAVRQYQHRDETTLLETFQRLMDERNRIAQMRPPEYVQALEAVLADAAEWMQKDGGAKVGGEPCRHAGGCKWQRAESVLARAADALKRKQ